MDSLLTAMPFTRFKLKKADASTQLAFFDKQPSWGDFTSKIYELYNIPLGQVGVALVDQDKDIFTFSHEEGLQNFYKSQEQSSLTTDRSPSMIKFVVQDLMVPDSECAF
jgi:hypothetical protein